MKNTVKGKFSITTTPGAADEVLQKIGAMCMTFNKTFEGDLQAASIVSMLGIMNKELGSGGYVAMERITGTLKDSWGSFCLQHSSTMNRGVPVQSITVVPDSGTSDLKGISGKMTIDIVDGQHFYTFEYAIEEQPAT